MAQEKYGVRLAAQEKGRLRRMIRSGRSSAQAITRARILLKIDEGWSAPQAAAALDVSERTVFRTKRRYAEEGLDEVLRHHNQVNRPRKVDEKVEAHPVSSTGQALIALACSRCPMVMTTGPCGPWQARWWSWDWWSLCHPRRSACG